MAKSNEPIWWGPFSAGGQISAFLTPITVIITGIAVPAGWISAQGLFNLIHHPLARLYLFVLIWLSLFHGSHRTLTTLAELGLKGIRGLLAVLCYGTAIVGTVLAAVLLIRL
jgi:succinate dehydrogenase subunit D